MDDESAFNGNWRAVLLAFGLLLLAFLYLIGSALSAIFSGLMSLIGG